MKNKLNRPYLVVPHLIEQSTWGGSYITTYKGVTDKSLQLQKIGQSYELYGKSPLSFADDTADPQFQQDVALHNNKDHREEGDESIHLQQLISADPVGILGPSSQKYKRMPLLIKFTQAFGNSFQVHRKIDSKDSQWEAKPESWYYLEDGVLTYGIKKGADLGLYRKTVASIENFMKDLSNEIQEKKISLKDAEQKAKNFIQSANPWQYVNMHRVKKHTIVDLSAGGIHHSWEDDPVAFPLGNVVYEVQLDVTDALSTMRSFDKGKIRPDGTVRPLHIEDYFKHLDTDPEHNDFEAALRKRSGEKLLQTPYYSLDVIHLSKEQVITLDSSFVHLFVVEGEIYVETPDQVITVGKGHSCIIPHMVKVFSLSPSSEKSIILKTYIQ